MCAPSVRGEQVGSVLKDNHDKPQSEILLSDRKRSLGKGSTESENSTSAMAGLGSIDITKLLHMEAQRVTDTNSMLWWVSIAISVVTVLIALITILSAAYGLRHDKWKEGIREEQEQFKVKIKEIDKKYEDYSRTERKETKYEHREIKAELERYRIEFKEQRREFRQDLQSRYQEQHEEIERIRSDAKDREKDIRTAALNATERKVKKTLERQLREYDKQVSQQIGETMEAAMELRLETYDRRIHEAMVKAAIEASAQHSDLLHRVELVRFELMSDISEGLPPKNYARKSLDIVVGRLRQHQKDSLALIQLLSLDEKVLFTGLGTFIARSEDPPASLCNLLHELDTQGRFSSPNVKPLYERLIARCREGESEKA
jgi:hypothetical protein